MNTPWIWFVVGLVPYYVNIQRVRSGWILHVRGLFWSLEIQRLPRGRKQWTLHIPLIKRIRKAIWVAIIHLQGDGSSRE